MITSMIQLLSIFSHLHIVIRKVLRGSSHLHDCVMNQVYTLAVSSESKKHKACKIVTQVQEGLESCALGLGKVLFLLPWDYAVMLFFELGLVTCCLSI